MAWCSIARSGDGHIFGMGLGLIDDANFGDCRQVFGTWAPMMPCISFPHPLALETVFHRIERRRACIVEVENMLAGMCDTSRAQWLLVCDSANDIHCVSKPTVCSQL